MSKQITTIPATENQSNKRLMVAAYCRVSTEYEEQRQSLKSQVAYYTQKICDNPAWDFAGIYAEQESGTRIDNRDEIQRLINDCINGKVDLILMKSLSRFGHLFCTDDSTTILSKSKEHIHRDMTYPYEQCLYVCEVILMSKGIVLFLNGVTSTGKTTLAKAIQEKADVNFYAFSNDTFQQMISMKFLQQDYWRYLSEAIIQAYQTAKMMSDNGINVIFDGMLLDIDELRPHYKRLTAIMENTPLKIVEVFCPLEICRQRNIERGDRGVNQSDEQNSIMAKDVRYDIIVDTHQHTPEQCAEIILGQITDYLYH